MVHLHYNGEYKVSFNACRLPNQKQPLGETSIAECLSNHKRLQFEFWDQVSNHKRFQFGGLRPGCPPSPLRQLPCPGSRGRNSRSSRSRGSTVESVCLAQGWWCLMCLPFFVLGEYLMQRSSLPDQFDVWNSNKYIFIRVTNTFLIQFYPSAIYDLMGTADRKSQKSCC